MLDYEVNTCTNWVSILRYYRHIPGLCTQYLSLVSPLIGCRRVETYSQLHTGKQYSLCKNIVEYFNFCHCERGILSLLLPTLNNNDGREALTPNQTESIERQGRGRAPLLSGLALHSLYIDIKRF